MLQQSLVRRPVVDLTIYLDEEESNGIHNVYRFHEDDTVTIFYSVPDNLATLTLEMEPDSILEDGLFLSSENFEDWEELTEIIPAWTVVLRRIETLYRHTIEEMEIDQKMHWDSDDE
jgi:hypothetical protein